MTTKERYQLVKEGICEITNVILHQTSEYMVSPVVFPTYFIKEKAKAYEMNCELDIRLFGKCIAPELGITDRYVGSEPVCEVTRTYNKCLREQLPWYQIRFHEIPRKTYDNQVISASEVRKKYAVNQLESIRGMLPESTRWYLERKKMKGVREASLEDVLWNRERRIATQKELLEIYPGTLICFLLNIPGSEKVNKTFEMIFYEGWKRFRISWIQKNSN